MEPYKELEIKYANFAGTKYAVSCSSGTSGLHLSLLALGIGPGDEVILPDFTMAACGFAVAYTGATPVFVDCSDNLCIDPGQIEAKITKRTRAIMVVDIYGRRADYKRITKTARRNNLWVIRDGCEAQGVQAKADLTVYSFFKNKIINAEEGGIVCTDDKHLYERMQYLKCMAFGPEHDYYHKEIGFNYRIPNSQAKLALKSLKDYPKNNKKRRLIESWYDEYIPKSMRMPKRDAVWVYDIIHSRKNRLVESIPGARHFFKPLSTMPMWSRPVSSLALQFSQVGCYLPVHPKMTKKQVKMICKKVQELL